jgi:hypothetical protein
MDRDIFDDFFTHNDPLKQIYGESKDSINNFLIKNPKGKEDAYKTENNSFSLDTPPGLNMDTFKFNQIKRISNEFDLSALPPIPSFSSKKECGIQNLSSEMSMPNTPDFKTPNLKKKKHNVSSDSFSSIGSTPVNLENALTTQLSVNKENIDSFSFSENDCKKTIDFVENSTPRCKENFYINKKILEETPIGKNFAYDETTPLFKANMIPNKTNKFQTLNDSYKKNYKSVPNKKNETTTPKQDENLENNITPNQNKKVVQSHKKEETKQHFSPLTETSISFDNPHRKSYSPIENNMKNVSLYSPSNHELLRIEEESEFEESEKENHKLEEELVAEENTETIKLPSPYKANRSLIKQEEDLNENFTETLQVEIEINPTASFSNSQDQLVIQTESNHPNERKEKEKTESKKEDFFDSQNQSLISEDQSGNLSENISSEDKIHLVNNVHHLSLINSPFNPQNSPQNYSFSYFREHKNHLVDLSEKSQEISKIHENELNNTELSSSSENFCESVTLETTEPFNKSPKRSVTNSDTVFTFAPNSTENNNQQKEVTPQSNDKETPQSNDNKEVIESETLKKENLSTEKNESIETEDNCTRVLPKNVSISPQISNEEDNLSNLANIYNIFFQKYVDSLKTGDDYSISFTSISSIFSEKDPQQLFDDIKTLENTKLLKIVMTLENQITWKVSI